MRNIKDNIKTIGDLETKNITANKVIVNDTITDDKQATTKKYVNDEINTTKQAITQETDTKLATKADKTVVNTNTQNIAKNANDINTNKANITTNTTNIASNKEDIVEIFHNLSQFSDNISDIFTKLSDLDTGLSNLDTKISDLEGQVNINTDSINTKVVDVTNQVVKSLFTNTEDAKIIQIRTDIGLVTIASFLIKNYDPKWGDTEAEIAIASTAGVATINSNGGSNWERSNATNCRIYPGNTTKCHVYFVDDKNMQDIDITCIFWNGDKGG